MTEKNVDFCWVTSLLVFISASFQECLLCNFRDSRHEIRALCIAEMGHWMKEYRCAFTSFAQGIFLHNIEIINHCYCNHNFCFFVAPTFWVTSFWSILCGAYMIRQVLSTSFNPLHYIYTFIIINDYYIIYTFCFGTDKKNLFKNQSFLGWRSFP